MFWEPTTYQLIILININYRILFLFSSCYWSSLFLKNLMGRADFFCTSLSLSSIRFSRFLFFRRYMVILWQSFSLYFIWSEVPFFIEGFVQQPFQKFLWLYCLSRMHSSVIPFSLCVFRFFGRLLSMLNSFYYFFVRCWGIAHSRK